MKFDRKQLGLNRETLRNLGPDQLDRVAGGTLVALGGRVGVLRNPCTDATPVTCIVFSPTLVGDTCGCTVFQPGCD